jgi:hypothetical protein
MHDRIHIHRPKESAVAAGLMEGDQLVSINGVSCQGFTYVGPPCVCCVCMCVCVRAHARVGVNVGITIHTRIPIFSRFVGPL